MLTPLLATKSIGPLLSAPPALVSTLSAPSALVPTLPATLLATAAPGTVDAPIWVLPVAAAACGLIPVMLLAMSKASGAVNGVVEPTGATDLREWTVRVQGPPLWSVQLFLLPL